MIKADFLDELPPEAEGFTPAEISEAEQLYRDLIVQYQKDIEQDKAGTLKRVYRLTAFRAVKAKKDLPEQQADKPKKSKGEVIQLALKFPERTRPTSNMTIRSALFAAIQGEDRQLFNDVILSSQDGIKVIFSGEQLNQDDHDVFMQLVAMAIHKPLGEELEISARAILDELGRGKGGREHERLKEEIHRLVKATINIKCNGINFIGHLVDSAVQDEKTPQHRRYWNYRLNPDVARLFVNNQYTLVDWGQRKNLKQKDLARWLHLYFASHTAPFPVSVEFLRDKSGSRTKELRKFRQSLKKALGDLIAISFLADWEIDKSDLVHVVRTINEAVLIIPHETKQALPSAVPTPNLKPATIEKFRALYAGYDPYNCKSDFDKWLEGKTAPRDYDIAFLGFARKWATGKF
ncbi:MAG: plasmid replication initiator TrfA [Methylovulum sp.]|nr:plasmid replication initiator TrfA [Methylovulum sp.]